MNSAHSNYAGQQLQHHQQALERLADMSSQYTEQVQRENNNSIKTSFPLLSSSTSSRRESVNPGFEGQGGTSSGPESRYYGSASTNSLSEEFRNLDSPSSSYPSGLNTASSASIRSPLDNQQNTSYSNMLAQPHIQSGGGYPSGPSGMGVDPYVLSQSLYQPPVEADYPNDRNTAIFKENWYTQQPQYTSQGPGSTNSFAPQPNQYHSQYPSTSSSQNNAYRLSSMYSNPLVPNPGIFGAGSVNPDALQTHLQRRPSDSAMLDMDEDPDTPPLQALSPSAMASGSDRQLVRPLNRRRSDSYLAEAQGTGVRQSDRISAQRRRTSTMGNKMRKTSTEIPFANGMMLTDEVEHRLEPFEMADDDELEELEQLERGGASMRKDKRRLQNRFAQRAFRARSKVNRKEAASYVADIEDRVKAQEIEIEKMKDIIGRLQEENTSLKRERNERSMPRP